MLEICKAAASVSCVPLTDRSHVSASVRCLLLTIGCNVGASVCCLFTECSKSEHWWALLFRRLAAPLELAVSVADGCMENSSYSVLDFGWRMVRPQN